MSLPKSNKQLQSQYLQNPRANSNFPQPERENLPDYPYGVPTHISGSGNVAGVAGSSQAQPRHPNAAPAPHYPPNANQQLQTTVGVMPQGPPPGAYIQHGHLGPMDMSKGTPPMHQAGHLHHAINQGGLAGQTPQMAHPNQAQIGARGPQNPTPYYHPRNNAVRPMGPHPQRPAQITTQQMNANPGTQPPMPYAPQPMYVIVDSFGANGQVPYPQAAFVPPGAPAAFYPAQGNIAQTQYTQTRGAAPQQQFFNQTVRAQYPPYPGMQPTPVYYGAQQQQGLGQVPPSQAADTSSKKRTKAIPIINPDTMQEVHVAATVPGGAATVPSTSASPAPAAAPAPTTEKPSQPPTPTETATPVRTEEPPAPAEPEIISAPQPTTVPQPKEVEEAPVAASSVVKENGDLASSSEPASESVSPSPVSTPTSPDAVGDWRAAQKGRSARKGSRTTPPARSDVQPVAEAVSCERSAPSSVEREEQPEQSVSSPADSSAASPATAGASLEKSDAETAAETPASTPGSAPSQQPVEAVPNGEKSEVTPAQTPVSEMETTPASTGEEESETAVTPKLRHVYKDDQWSPANPEGKKIYDRDFLLKLQEEPASLKKPEGLPNLEVVRDRAAIKRTNDFTPPFMKQLVPSQPKGLTKRHSQQGRGSDQGMGGPPRREIKLGTISLGEKARLPEPENAWKPKHALKTKEEDPEKAKTEELFKTVRGILNKLTPSKFDKLTQKIAALSMDTEERLAGVIKIFFEKAVDEPIFSSTYAKMCQALSNKEAPSAANPQEITSFRKLLLTRCQKEFEKDKAQLHDVEVKKEAIVKAESDEKKKELEDELEELVNKNRRRSLGNIRFIGELFKLRILSAKIMFTCITRLLSQPDDEESLECLCRLLSTIGRELEEWTRQPQTGRGAAPSPNQMDKCFSSLDDIVNTRKISNRIRFMIQDVVDLRRNNWKPRREDNNPKTIDQIHKEVEKEREEQEKELANMPLFPGPMGSMGGSRQGDRRDDRERKRSRGGMGQSEDGWNTVSGGSRKQVDFSQIKIPSAISLESQGSPLKLGPGGRGFQAWGRGASGGGSQGPRPGAPAPSPGESPAGNRFMLLDNESGQGGFEHPKPFGGRASLGGGVPPRHQDYRGVAGATKSVMLPPKDVERERVFESMRSQNIGKSRSQQSSRESSVSRSEMQPPSAVPREPVLRESLLRGDPKMSDDLIAKKAHALIDEFISQDNLEDALKEVKEKLHADTAVRFINEGVLHVIETNRENRTKTGGLLRELLKQRIFSLDLVVDGLSETLQAAEDFLVDIPKLWDYIGELVAPIFVDGVVPLRLLGRLAKPLHEIGKPDFVACLIAAVVKELVKTEGEGTVAELWSCSNAQLTSMLPEGFSEADFVQKNGLEFLQRAAAPRSSSVSRGQIVSMMNELTNFLKKQPDASPSDILNLLEPWSKGGVDAPFIRALVTVIIESCIDGMDATSKLNKDKLKSYKHVLCKFIEAVASFELQALFAVQALVNQRQHPKGLIQSIFETLYDDSVISEEGFEAWNKSDDPSEREGKAVAQKSLASFLTWLNEADAESSEGD